MVDRGAKPPFSSGEPLTGSAAAAVTPLAGLTGRSGGLSSGPLSPGEAFGSRYHIIKLLGAGSMGAVYQAWDQELGVTVALKVIRPDAVADQSAAQDLERRFKRELLLARQVTHKNVVRIYDLGEIDGIKYITMSYVEGEDLATTLKREGKLPIERALRVARQIVAGLAAAHEAGVVHRDLKPANIMIDAEDNALIMDFGIARSDSARRGRAVDTVGVALESMNAQMTSWRPATTEASAASEGPAGILATRVGTVVGTMEYMAPEQARGKVVDHRVDIYAFGLILTDMLMGPALRAAHLTPLNELHERLDHAPRPLRSRDTNIAEPVDDLIARCVQPDPDARFATAFELSAALDRLDDAGQLLPEVRSGLGWRGRAAAALLVVALVAGTWWLSQSPAPVVQPDPMSVLIADFENRANDPVFEGSLEQTLGVAMEGASFISAYARSDALAAAAQLRPGVTTVDLDLARLISQREGIKVVLAGVVESAGSSYRVSVRAIDPIPGNEIATASATAKSKQDVLAAVRSVAAQIREALGDTVTETALLIADETVTATSLEASRDYSTAQALANSNRHEEAITYYERAIQRDPELGRAYSGWAISADRLGRKEESAELWKKALSLLERMTEREKYRTLGTYYSAVVRNNEKAIETFSALTQKYPADRTAHNNLAVAYFRALDFGKAMAEGGRLFDIYPNVALYQYNYALYAMYAGQFQIGRVNAEMAIKVNPQTPKAYLALAMAALARGSTDEARAAYDRGAQAAGPRGASLASIGLADIAMYEGRYADAEQVLKTGMSADQANKDTAGVAAKQIALAEVYQAQGKSRLAVSAVDAAVKTGRAESTLVPAVRILLAAGREDEARALAVELSQRLQPQSQAHGKIIEGEIALHRHRPAEAVEAFRAAQKLADLWLARFGLGVAYVEAGHHAEALSELEACQKRQGEATAVFLDDVPSFRYMAPLAYWLGRAQEGVGLQTAASASYKKFLSIRLDTQSDPITADARERIGRQ